ncbi:MAG: hypothetical protein OEM83_04200 [Gammaproteobacteria bacterium]|nr:hypothetical protein [Gammaproteobacteria bacterium]MDH5512394.1 hypothetical protein [Gammaproteobacteria bacterium]
MDRFHYFKTAGRFLRPGFMALALMMAAIPARAASVSFFLDQSNALPDGTNYLSVMLTENDAGGVDFLVQTLDPLDDIAGRNFGIQKFSFSFLDASWGDIENLPSGWRVLNNQRKGIFKRQMSSFGKFDILLQGRGSSRTDELSFTVNDVTLEDFDTLMSAHVAGFDWGTSDQYQSNFKRWRWGNRCKGCITSAFFAGQMGSLPVPVPAAVPLPPAVWLFGSGLLAMAGIAKRRRLN